MAGTLKKVEFIRPWQNFRVGDTLTPTGMDRDWLLANGYVKLVEPAAGPQRPALLSSRAAKKLAEGVKGLFPGK